MPNSHEGHPDHNQHNKWIKCISTRGSIRGVAIQAGGLVSQMAQMHQLNGMQAMGLGELVMGSLLLASYCKPGERVNLNIRGAGQFVQGLADAYPDGSVRGYVIPREPEQAFFGEHNELGPWGSGMMSVLRAKSEPGAQPYIGTVPLVTGHLAKDLTFYWTQSEQVPSAVGLAVNVRGNEVVAAAGFLVQAMPEATAEEVKAIEKHVHEIQSLANYISHDSDPVQLLSQIFQDSSFLLIDEKPLQFRCTCSRERAEKALILSGAEELRDILAKEGKTEVNCDFCTNKYEMSREDLERLLAGKKNGS